MRLPTTAKRLAVVALAALGAITAGRFIINTASAVTYDDSSDSATAHVERVCFFVQNRWDYNEVKGEVCGYTQATDGGVAARRNCVGQVMSGANLTAVQNMLTTQAGPLWVALQP